MSGFKNTNLLVSKDLSASPIVDGDLIVFSSAKQLATFDNNTVKTIPYTTEVAAISSGLNSLITTINATDSAQQTTLSRLTSVSGSYALSSLVISMSAGLNSRLTTVENVNISQQASLSQIPLITGQFINRFGDSMAGTLNLSGADFSVANPAARLNFRRFIVATDSTGQVTSGANIGLIMDNMIGIGVGSATGLRITPGGMTFNSSNTVWHAGNMGSGSGLDADTIDGLDSSNFAYNSVVQSMSAGLNTRISTQETINSNQQTTLSQLTSVTGGFATTASLGAYELSSTVIAMSAGLNTRLSTQETINSSQQTTLTQLTSISGNYVKKSGDSMTGGLTGQNIYATRIIQNGGAYALIRSNDVQALLKLENSQGTTKITFDDSQILIGSNQVYHTGNLPSYVPYADVMAISAGLNATKANDSSVVHLNGNETINNVKTFTDDLITNKGSRIRGAINSAVVANEGISDIGDGYRFLGVGPDASTNGTVKLITCTSNAGGYAVALAATGGVLDLIPSGGTARVAGQNIVATNDSRLSDARTPTAHASTHASTGSDPITVAQSQVTNLTTDLSNKLNVSSYTAPDIMRTEVSSVSGYLQSQISSVATSAGLKYFTESVNNTAPNTPWTSHILTPNTTATNVDIVLQTKGLGALIRDIPDSTATGGNKRGQNAVDLQRTRDSADDVASGTNSVVIGGSSNSATNNGSVSIGGNSNTATGAYAAVIGSGSSQANGTTSGIFCGSGNRSDANAGVIAGGAGNKLLTGVDDTFIGGGYGNNISGSATYAGVCGGYGAALEATCTFSGGGRGAKVAGSYSGNIAGYNNTIWGSYSVAVGGFTNYILGNYCAAIGASNANINGLNNVVVMGDTPIAKLDSSTIRGGVPSNTLGGYQVEETMMGTSTSTATATALMTPAGIAYIPIGAGECVTVHGVVSAFQNTTTNNAAGYVFEVSAKNVGGTVTIIGQTVRAEYANNTAWNMTATVVAGTGIAINAVGAASVTIHWGGSFKIVRVKGA